MLFKYIKKCKIDMCSWKLKHIKLVFWLYLKTPFTVIVKKVQKVLVSVIIAVEAKNS